MTECAERQRDELDALAAIYGDEFELHDVAPGEMASCALRSAENTATLYMRLPHSYPAETPPEIDCTDASLLERLRSVVLSDGNEWERADCRSREEKVRLLRREVSNLHVGNSLSTRVATVARQ